MKKLKLRVTRQRRLKLVRGDNAVTIRTIGELERIGHQALDLAVMRRDASRALVAANPPSTNCVCENFPCYCE
jgi:hypothetical protein